MNRPTRGAESAGGNQEVDGDVRERLLNAAIIAADIAGSFEEYVDILDRFYADDFVAVFEMHAERIEGKAAVQERLTGFLVPLHISAEVCGVSVSIAVRPVRGAAAGETRSAWTLTATGTSGATCTRMWRTVRKWRDGQVVSEYYHDSTQIGDALTEADLRPKSDGSLPWRLN
jgi:hypothetical protein